MTTPTSMTRKYAVRVDSQDYRDFPFRATKISQLAQVPRQVDLRQAMSPIVDQGKLGTSISCAIVSGLKQYWMRYEDRKIVDLSPLYHHWTMQKSYGDSSSTLAFSIRQGMKALHQFGVCEEADYPYDLTKGEHKPSEDAEQRAYYHINGYKRVRNLLGVKIALAEDQPVVFGMKVYSSFLRVSKSGVIPYPNRSKDTLLGTHAMLIVGYVDKKKSSDGYFIVRNSMGTSWGDQGYGYLRYSFFKKKGMLFDLWTGK
ncbi:C1 family peptidase [Paenibacillus sp. N1-5-1-14]|uniref:C1 family peptidase n=1 Tax=Paenibacillus radicibacter TaxID=2972488 RepID=UPI00215911AB|nr:C1 family peptidase [Paenibacillus radicibacter]MCR8645745.1 C1 family peptidase [Paenibacillus radicibacter]